MAIAWFFGTLLVVISIGIGLMAFVVVQNLFKGQS